MRQPTSNPRCYHLQPGQLYLSRKPVILQTTLGSCVGATFWSKRLKTGALCHGVLPKCPLVLSGTNGRDGAYYVDFSIRHLAREFDALGATRDELEVKLFGGADVLPVSDTNVKLTVGALNCQAAAEALAQEGLRVIASDLRGTRGRKIQFDTGTGEVLVQRLG